MLYPGNYVQFIYSYNKYPIICCDHYVPVICTQVISRVSKTYSGGREWGGAAGRGENIKSPEGTHGKWRTWRSRKPIPLPRSMLLCLLLCGIVYKVLYPLPLKKLYLVCLLESLTITWLCYCNKRTQLEVKNKQIPSNRLNPREFNVLCI